MAEEEPGPGRRAARRLREWASVVADFWDAARFVALCVAVIAAGVIGSVLFVVTVVPSGFLVMILFGIGGLVFVAAQPLVRLILPAPPPRPVAIPPQSSPYVDATRLTQQQNQQEAEQRVREETMRLRRAVRLIREELLDNKHALQRWHQGEQEAVEDVSFVHWHEQGEVLLGHGEPEPYDKAGEAYREIGVMHKSQFVRSDYNHFVLERNPGADPPLDTDFVWAIEKIDEAVKVLAAQDQP